MDDARLVEKARTGDAEAFSELVRRHRPGLLRQAYLMCGRWDVAEDVTQEVLLQASKAIHRYNGKCRFFTWLTAILVRRARNVGRGKSVSAIADSQLTTDQDVASVSQLADNSSGPSDLTEISEEGRLLRQSLERLPKRHKEVIWLRFFNDEDLNGIAAALGCRVGTVKSRLFHALEKLRKMQHLRNLRL